jgi:carbohydrate diacid regulator
MVNLSARLAQDIVDRTMRIIPFNVNVMDARGVILASGDHDRVGTVHDGALLALARRATVEVDAASARLMHGARPGINLPLTVGGQLCGAVGLSGEPAAVRQFGELVRLTAEMILEQASLAGELQRDSRYREAFLLNLIRSDAAASPELAAWGRRLGIDFTRVQAAFLLELDAGGDAARGDDDAHALAALQRLQLDLLAREPALLSATVGPRELVLLDVLPADVPGQAQSIDALALQRLRGLDTLARTLCERPFTLTLGLASIGIDAAAVSYGSARTAARIGRRRDPAERVFSYYGLALPVLLSGLDTGWQADQLRQPMVRLMQERGGASLRRTLDTWFACHENAAATAAALHIHRNTLDYRLRRVAALTGLDLARNDDRLLLYVAVLISPA